MTLQMSSPVRLIKVPHPDDMSDEQFLQHMDKRHAREGFRHYTKHITPDQIELWRKYHDRLHQIAVPNQHDHEHLG